jgi:hypothetical protein
MTPKPAQAGQGWVGAGQVRAKERAQVCQMVSFLAKNPNLGKFWRALDWKMLIYFMAIWNILQTFGIFYDHLVHFVFILCSFGTFGIIHQEKSGNPGALFDRQLSFDRQLIPVGERMRCSVVVSVVVISLLSACM